MLCHRRIRINDLIPPSLALPSPSPPSDESTAFDLDSLPSISRALVSNAPDEPFNKRNPFVKALVSELLANIKELIRFNSQLKEQITVFTYTTGANLVEEPTLVR
jgi:hypothetical protein